MNLDAIQLDQVRSLSVVRQLLPWRGQLASKFGTQHGNASLELIDVLIVLLAGFFNPMVRSQRLLDALSSQQWMQSMTDVQRVPRSTLSDALKRFDPQVLHPLIEQLVARIPALHRRDGDLEQVTRQVLAGDGSYFNLAGEVAWALSSRRGNTDENQSRVRLNLQLDVRSFTPVDCDVSGADDASEPDAVTRRLRSGVIYVVDRNFVHFRFISAVLDAGSNLVLRLRKSTRFSIERSQELTERDRAEGVLADEIGYLTGGKDTRGLSAAPPQRPLRRVKIWDERNGCELVLLTDMLDVSAYVIGALYRQRWQIELFFKWLKCYARIDHLISQHPHGITLQFYVAVIGTLLLHLATGRKVSKYAIFWLSSVMSGHASWEQMQAGLARIEREKELEKARLDRKRLAAQQLH